MFHYLQQSFSQQYVLPSGVDRFADMIVGAGLAAVMLHPTFASLFGATGSRYAGLAALALLLPSLRHVQIAPLLGVMLAAAVLAFLSREVTPFFAAIAGYALYEMLDRRPQFTSAVFYGVLAAATFVAFLQMWMPPLSVVNFHATAQSKGGWLNQIRPTSLFPSQVYLSQIQLICVALMAITGERRIGVFVLLGLSCAFAGSTGGLVATALASTLVWQRGWYAGVVYVLVLLGLYLFAPWRFEATSPVDAAESVLGTRVLIDEAADAIARIAVADNGAPNMGLIAIKLAGIAGAILAALAIVPRLVKANYINIARIGLVLILVAISQAVLPVIESLFFGLSLGIIITALVMLDRIPKRS